MCKYFLFAIFITCLSCNSSNTKSEIQNSDSVISTLENSKLEGIIIGCKQYVVNDISDFSLDNAISLNMMGKYESEFSKDIYIGPNTFINGHFDTVIVYKNIRDTIIFFKNDNINCILHSRIFLNSNIFKELLSDNDLNSYYLDYLTDYKCFSVVNIEASQYLYFNSDEAGESFIVFDSPYLSTQIDWDSFTHYKIDYPVHD
jgi:hypothetical protein